MLVKVNFTKKLNETPKKNQNNLGPDASSQPEIYNLYRFYTGSFREFI